MSQSQYLVLAVMHALHRRRMDPTRLVKNAWGMPFQMRTNARESSANVIGWFGNWRRRRSISSHACSIGDVWWCRRPWQHINIVLSKKISHNACNVWSGVVVLQRNGMLTHKRDDVGLQNLIAVPCTSQISVNDHKRRSCVSCYSTPYHYTAPAKETTFNNTVILVPFTNSTVYPGTTITAIQVETWLVWEQDTRPISSSKAKMGPAPRKASRTVTSL